MMCAVTIQMKPLKRNFDIVLFTVWDIMEKNL